MSFQLQEKLFGPLTSDFGLQTFFLHLTSK